MKRAEGASRQNDLEAVGEGSGRVPGSPDGRDETLEQRYERRSQIAEQRRTLDALFAAATGCMPQLNCLLGVRGLHVFTNNNVDPKASASVNRGDVFFCVRLSVPAAQGSNQSIFCLLDALAPRAMLSEALFLVEKKKIRKYIMSRPAPPTKDVSEITTATSTDAPGSVAPCSVDHGEATSSLIVGNSSTASQVYDATAAAASFCIVSPGCVTPPQSHKAQKESEASRFNANAFRVILDRERTSKGTGKEAEQNELQTAVALLMEAPQILVLPRFCSCEAQQTLHMSLPALFPECFVNSFCIRCKIAIHFFRSLFSAEGPC